MYESCFSTSTSKMSKAFKIIFQVPGSAFLSFSMSSLSAAFTQAASTSTPNAVKPSSLASASTVPRPQKGSITTSRDWTWKEKGGTFGPVTKASRNLTHSKAETVMMMMMMMMMIMIMMLQFWTTLIIPDPLTVYRYPPMRHSNWDSNNQSCLVFTFDV